MSERTGGWMQTYSGKQIWPLDPRPDEIDLMDICHHLGNVTRYGGATRDFYSVAQHAVLVSTICKPEHALTGLLHDAAEAYTGDMIRPLKHGPFMEEFRAAEHRLEEMISRKYGLVYPFPEDVVWADAVLLATEKRDLLARPQTDMDEVEWLHGAPAEHALDHHIWAVGPHDARLMFIHRYKEILRDRQRAVQWTEPAARAPFTGTPYDPEEVT